MQTPLTELSIKALKPEGTQRTHFDGSIPGFGLRISPAGTKTFVLMHGKSRQLTTIGRYGIITLAQARTKARELLAQKTLGTYHAPTLTFEDAYQLFQRTHCARKRPRTQRDYTRIIKRHLLPKLRKEKLEDISVHTLAPITDKLLSTPSELAHTQAVARTFFRWCVRRHYLKHSPLEGMQITRQPSRDRVLSDKELVSVYRAAEIEGYPFGDIVRLCILTGQRRSEIGSLRWEHIDQDARLITFPANMIKNNRQHTFPYPAAVQAIFAANPKKSRVHIFPARGKEHPFNGWSESKTRFDKALEIDPWTLHDLRRTFATNLAALGVPPHITERLLNHVTGTISGVAAIYNRHAYMDEMRQAVAAWENKLLGLLAR